MRFRVFIIILIQIILSDACLAQSGDSDDGAEKSDGRFLLDLSFTSTDSLEGTIDTVNPGFTWLVRPDIRVGVNTTYVTFTPDSSTQPDLEGQSSSRGPGDSVVFLQYDWQERLTASPWIPDNVGTSLTVLAPTGDARKSLGADTWAANLAVSWPIEFKGGLLVNPVISYEFTFNEGPLADPTNLAEAGVGIIKLFPSKFWVGYTPLYWYDFDINTWNFDSHITVGKMFPNGIGIGLDYGRLARHFIPNARDDNTFLFNLYYQFGH